MYAFQDKFIFHHFPFRNCINFGGMARQYIKLNKPHILRCTCNKHMIKKLEYIGTECVMLSYKINQSKLMGVPTLTSGTCPFPKLGVLVVFFIFPLSHTDIVS